MSELSSNKLKQALSSAGYSNQYLQLSVSEHTPVATGSIRWQKLANGLQLHFCNHVENQFGTSSVKLDACLSFNFLYKGNLEFSLGNRHYQLQTAEESPTVFISNVLENEVFTRFIKSEQHVIKLNITASRCWLLTRLANITMPPKLESFLKSSQVITLTDATPLLVLADQLMKCSSTEDLNHVLQCEALATQFVTTGLKALEQGQYLPLHPTQTSKHSMSAKQALECQIKHYIQNSFKQIKDVSQIAQHFSVSSSTLQRRFKSKHGTTVNECLRSVKLEHAKRELLLNRVSIGEAAYNAGYNHVSNFVSAFTRYFGLSPSQYLKQHSL